jgi:hypothetical protein
MKPEHYEMLAEAKLTVEQIGVVMRIMSEAEEAMKAAEDARKSVARERVQRWRDKQKDAVTLPKHNGNATVRLTRVEDSSSKKDNNKEDKKESAAKPRGVDDFVAELSPILDAERIDALVAVRRKKGAVLSAHAGKLLSQALLACPNVNAAADEMVLRNWTGIKPEWLDKRTTGPPTGKRMNAVEANLARRIRRNEPDRGRPDYGDAELILPDKSGLPDFAGNVGKALTWDG